MPPVVRSGVEAERFHGVDDGEQSEQSKNREGCTAQSHTKRGSKTLKARRFRSDPRDHNETWPRAHRPHEKRSKDADQDDRG